MLAEPIICSPEDIVLAKLEWYRMGGKLSDRQWRDILGVFDLLRKALKMADIN